MWLNLIILSRKCVKLRNEAVLNQNNCYSSSMSSQETLLVLTHICNIKLFVFYNIAMKMSTNCTCWKFCAQKHRLYIPSPGDIVKQWSFEVWCACGLRSSHPQRIWIEAGFGSQPSAETRFGQMSALLLNMEKVISVKSVWWPTIPKSAEDFCIWTSDFQVCMSVLVKILIVYFTCGNKEREIRLEVQLFCVTTISFRKVAHRFPYKYIQSVNKCNTLKGSSFI